jgi:hypothetical protein
MEVDEGMDIRRKIKIILHSKTIMEIHEEVGECRHRIKGSGQDRRKGRLQLMDTEVDMIKEEVAKGEDIPMEARQREEEADLHLWSDLPLQIQDVSRAKGLVRFMLMIHSESTRTATPEAIENTTNVSRPTRMG